MSEWRDISTAPKGGGAEMVTDPAWVEPPRILLLFADEPNRDVVLAYWDWYYAAPDGHGYEDGVLAWVIDRTAETVDKHFDTGPTHWMPLPEPPK